MSGFLCVAGLLSDCTAVKDPTSKVTEYRYGSNRVAVVMALVVILRGRDILMFLCAVENRGGFRRLCAQATSLCREAPATGWLHKSANQLAPLAFSLQWLVYIRPFSGGISPKSQIHAPLPHKHTTLPCPV